LALSTIPPGIDTLVDAECEDVEVATGEGEEGAGAEGHDFGREGYDLFGCVCVCV
jgi:hypothetical protein